ncbi:MAG: tRNA (adenosine(37)-N6)-dimethylallyltransferase MiaA [Flavobacteriaceae bacterium]|nr:tRNA (adenosine(37)-N6)-dimethylallyltransferase MiaA [Flavobacteriaceae bacterium]|tara:strand:- start:8547 stop:9455 length:909 start_codon:yes stop_codon:yes gene_type:complete
MSKFLISIVGPTAIGKTELSLKLATYFKTEIISADSRQFFKEIPIGTASPSALELKKIPHNFIHHKSITENYNVGKFEKDAIKRIETLYKKYSILILVGGSGLYINSILKGLDIFPDVNPKVRESLNLELKIKGIKNLRKELKLVDPLTYSRTDLNNSHRIIRALEVFRESGYPYSSYLNKQKLVRDFNIINIGLEADRTVIYDRINHRVDQMLKNGLEEEARLVYKYKGVNALNTVGYKEMFEYFEGKLTLENTVEEIKKNSRRFAKKQLTWFKKQENINWFNYLTPFEKILSQVKYSIDS